MKPILILSAFLLIFSFGCDRSKGKGSDVEWQQRQEEQERRERIDESRQTDENQREVRVN